MVDFINNSWTAFHAVQSCVKTLSAAGFIPLSEREEWSLVPGGKYYVIRNQSALVAFAVGGRYRSGNGFAIIGAHTDSPCIKLKPLTKLTRGGYLELAVQTYGGGLWHTWFDRDLGLAGRVVVRRPANKKNKKNKNKSMAQQQQQQQQQVGDEDEKKEEEEEEEEEDTIREELVRIDRPIARIPMLAIHLNRTIGTDGFKPNAESHLAPLLSTLIKAELMKPSEKKKTSKKNNNNKATSGVRKTGDSSGVSDEQEKGEEEDEEEEEGQVNVIMTVKNDTQSSGKPATQQTDHHHPLLLSILSKELKCAPEDILDFELQLCDVQPAVIGGALEEFIFAGRLDNLAMSWCATEALAATCSNNNSNKGMSGKRSTSSGSLEEEACVRCVALFDNEEVGSVSAQGAGGSFMMDVVTRVSIALGQGREGAVERTKQRSFLVSADMAHALHPNYMDKHESLHQPALHKGLVIKHNANQRYATSSVSASLFREVARRVGLPVQEFVVRQDCGCGSTIGPILSSGTGIRTVDVGAPQLSMHSIREMCGTDDIHFARQHFEGFFTYFTAVDASMNSQGSAARQQQQQREGGKKARRRGGGRKE